MRYDVFAPNTETTMKSVRLPIATLRSLERLAMHDGHGNVGRIMRDAIDRYVAARSAADGIDYSAAAGVSAVGAGATPLGGH